jgi:hypothetical protein
MHFAILSSKAIIISRIFYKEKTMQTQSGTVVGVFENSREAQTALNELKRAGFQDEHVGVVSHDSGTGIRRTTETAKETAKDVANSPAAKGAATGAVVGAGAGGLWVLGIAAGVLPGIGPVIAGGILGSILASAAIGAATGGVACALIGMGVPEEESHYYENEFKSGRTVVTVRATGRAEEARAILRGAGAYDIETRPMVHSHV